MNEHQYQESRLGDSTKLVSVRSRSKRALQRFEKGVYLLACLMGRRNHADFITVDHLLNPKCPSRSQTEGAL